MAKTGRMETCEDSIFVNEHFVVVLDGATSKTSKLWDGKTPGKIAMESVKEILPYMNPAVSAEKFFFACNEAISDWYKKKQVYFEMQQHINQRPTVSLIVYSNAKKQVWILGNGFAIIGDQYINSIIPTDILSSQLRSYYIQTELRRGVSEFELLDKDTSREFISPVLLRQVMFQNSDIPSEFDYFAVDGFYTDAKGIDIYKVPEHVKEVVLATDGYIEVFSTLEKSEKYLAQVLEEDPLLYKRHKSVKGIVRGNVSFDDRSYIRIKIH